MINKQTNKTSAYELAVLQVFEVLLSSQIPAYHELVKQNWPPRHLSQEKQILE